MGHLHNTTKVHLETKAPDTLLEWYAYVIYVSVTRATRVKTIALSHHQLWWNPIRVPVQFWLPASNAACGNVPRKAADAPHAWIFATSMGHRNELPGFGFWLQPGQVPVVLAIQGINQWEQDYFSLSLSFCPCDSTFQINKWILSKEINDFGSIESLSIWSHKEERTLGIKSWYRPQKRFGHGS